MAMLVGQPKVFANAYSLIENEQRIG